jgi:hypothetical protein
MFAEWTEEWMNDKQHPTAFQEGEIVLVTYQEGHKKGESTKFASQGAGPFCVIDKLSNEIYCMLHITTGNKQVVHVDRMQHFEYSNASRCMNQWVNLINRWTWMRENLTKTRVRCKGPALAPPGLEPYIIVYI